MKKLLLLMMLLPSLVHSQWSQTNVVPAQGMTGIQVGVNSNHYISLRNDTASIQTYRIDCELCIENGGCTKNHFKKHLFPGEVKNITKSLTKIHVYHVPGVYVSHATTTVKAEDVTSSSGSGDIHISFR